MEKLRRRMAAVALTLITMAFITVMFSGMSAANDSAAEPEATPASRPAAADRPHTKRETRAVPVELPAQEKTPETTPAPAPEPEPQEEEPPAEPEKEYTYYAVRLDDELQRYTQDLCEEYDFPYYTVVLAMMWRESGFTEDAISQTNDYGIMQINRCNHEWLREELGVTDFLDAKQNIRCGVYIIQDFYNKYDDIGLALMCYNCGEAGAKNLWAQGVWSTKYSRAIQQEAAELEIRTD